MADTTADTTLVILGASGDLASRLLLPALGQLLQSEPHRRLRLLGAGMDAWTDEQWRDTVRASFAAADAESAFEVVASTEYRTADITAREDLEAIFADVDGRAALYFAVPPSVAFATCRTLSEMTVPPGLILALEKPFGTDAESARTLNEVLGRIVPENQVFRVDHFLGRSTTLNILGVRFANRVFEPVWSAEHIESVTVRYDEKLGLEGRAGYYDHAGAFVDMIQSHLLQLLAVIAMGAPATLGEIDQREAKAAVLRATHVFGDDPVRSSRRARYTAGRIGDRDLPSYVDEPGVDPARGTETLAEATFEVRNARWAGVPFTLRSGKALGARHTEAVIRFRPVRHVPTGFSGDPEATVLRFTLGPDVMSLELNVNGPGDPHELDRAVLEADLGPGELLAYGEVLSGILDGDATLAVRGDSAEESWRIVQPVIDAWRRDEVPLEEYPAGSRGPSHWPDPTAPRD